MVNRGYEQPYISYIYLDLLSLDHKRGIVFSMWDYVGVFGCIWWIMKGACDILQYCFDWQLIVSLIKYQKSTKGFER